MKLVIVERDTDVAIDKNIPNEEWIEFAHVEEKYFPQHATTFPVAVYPEGIAYGRIKEDGVILIYANRELTSGKDQLFFQFLYFAI